MDTLQAIYFGQHHADFNYKDFAILQRIARLSKQHQKQATNSCNGYGIVKGQMYYGGQIDDYAKREYGYNVKSSYLDKDCEESIFDKEMGNIEDKINKLIENTKFTVEYQGDPRGWTVKLFYDKDQISW